MMRLNRYIVSAIGLSTAVFLPLKAQDTPEEKLNMTMYAIMNMYVDTVDKASFVDDMIARTVRTLDPFSAYLTPEEARANEEVLLGPTASGMASGPASGKTVQTAYMADAGTGYIRLTMFSESSPEEFRLAIERLKKQGMKKLILDIQGNPGGFMDSAIAIADELLGGSRTIVTTSGAHIPTESACTRTDGCFETGRVALLTNGQTMSAAEILAGALRDWDRAVIVGSTTFGKGLIQETLPFKDGSALRLTVARYLTPCGMTIQKPYEGYGKVFADTAGTFRSLANGRLLKSSGGIEADVHVPRDTVFMTQWYYNVSFNGMQKAEVSSYLRKNGDMLKKKYRNPDAYFRKFAGEDEMFMELTDMAAASGLPFDQEECDRSAYAIKTQLKALLARGLYPDDPDIYYKILNTANPAVVKALEVLSGDEYDRILGIK